MFLNGFSIGNVWGIFEVAYLSAVPPIEALFVVSLLGFGRLHGDIIFFAMRQSY